jgi:hypothetical protein
MYRTHWTARGIDSLWRRASLPGRGSWCVELQLRSPLRSLMHDHMWVRGCVRASGDVAVYPMWCTWVALWRPAYGLAFAQCTCEHGCGMGSCVVERPTGGCNGKPDRALEDAQVFGGGHAVGAGRGGPAVRSLLYTTCFRARDSLDGLAPRLFSPPMTASALRVCAVAATPACPPPWTPRR